MPESPLHDAAFMGSMRTDMLRFAQIQLRDATLAEDAVQEAFAAALDGARDFAGRSALKTWIFGILRHKIIDLIRHQSRHTNISAYCDEDTALDEAFEALFKENEHWAPHTRPRAWGDPEASLQQRQFWDVFEVCLHHLPENTARVFMMREFLEFGTDEVCTTLNISASNCHVILHRARNGLRRCLETGWFAAPAEGAPQ